MKTMNAKKRLAWCLALAAAAACVARAAAPYVESNVAFTLTTANAWVVQDLTALGIPPYAVCEVAIENGNTGAEIYGGVRACQSRLDRRFNLREAEGGGKVVAVMHVQANRDGDVECYAGNTGNITFRILGYWTRGVYVERFASFDPSKNNSWCDTSLTGYGVPGGSVVDIYGACVQSYGQATVGARAKGSALERRLSLGDARDGGLHGVSLWVQADASGVVQTYTSSADNSQHYLLGYWAEAPLPYTEVWALLPAPSSTSTWEVVRLPAEAAGGAVADVVMVHADTSTRTLGLQRGGSTANRQFAISKSFNAGFHVGLRAHVVADGDGRVEVYSSSPATTSHRLAGYWAQPAVDNANGATDVGVSSATLNGTLVTTGSYDTAVEVWYGPADGGTDILAWETGYSYGPGQAPGAFAYPAGALAADTLYFYRFAASNQTGRTWAGVADGCGPATFLTGNVWLGDVSDAHEQGLVPGTVMVHRVAGATAGPLTVNLTIGGSAEDDRHVAATPHEVTIPTGAASAPLVVTPIPEWFTQTNTFITASIATGPYLIDPATNGATVVIHTFNAPSSGGTNTWISDGTVADSTDGRNWSAGHAPLATEHVLLGRYSLDGGISDVGLNWAGHVDTVASWMQTADYTGIVTIPTVYDGQGSFTTLMIGGNAIVSGGTWRHPANPNGSTAKYRLNVSVAGDFTLGAAGAINLGALGFTGQDGPGKSTVNRKGATHGGRGNQAHTTYGSITSPSHLGSGGWREVYAGGGALWLEVAGLARLDGMIAADGTGGYNAEGASSGGSIRICAGTITGGGSVRANGGVDDWHGGGGGGRIALIQTAATDWTRWTGTVQSLGRPQKGASDSEGGGAGTIYRETSAEAGEAGLVTVDNNDYDTVPATYPKIACTLPSGQLDGSEALSRTRWEMKRHGHVNLVADCRIAALTITGSSPILHLYGKTLTLRALSINGTNYGPGVYTADDLPQVEDFVGGGRIVVLRGGSVLIVR